MNQSNWARVYSTSELYKAEIIRNILDEEGIQCVIVDKKDTAYGGTFGEVEIYVQRENVIRSKHVIEKKEL
jgi:Zn-dependent membrane protease YugP